MTKNSVVLYRKERLNMNELNILIYNLNKKFNLNSNTLFKLIYLFDWKCCLENLGQYTNLQYYFYKNLYVYDLKQENPKLLDIIFRKYKINKKYIKVFNFICDLYINEKEDINSIFISTYPYWNFFYYPPKKEIKINLNKISKKYKKYLEKNNKEYVFLK